MCGIVGFVRREPADATWLREVLGGMMTALRHRGPNAAGAWSDPSGCVHLGHRRLSVLDLSALGAQPMLSVSGRTAVVFNGEIYNHEELRRDLEQAGSAFRGRSDTEVLLAALEHWGPEKALSRLVGMFAFAAWDRHAGVLTLAVDRLAEKPLYYGWSGGVFLFGSELKALRAYPGWDARVDTQAVADYLARGCIAAPRSIYAGIARLRGGTFITLPCRDLTAGTMPATHAYWSVASAAAQTPWTGDSTAALDELERRLGTAVSLQMVADVPLGAFLSGGVDSSMVVALMAARARQPIRTFAIGFGEQEFNEAPYAREVARHLGTQHTELIVPPADALAVVPRLAQIYDEPFADSSQIPTFLVAELARQQVTVALSGDAGDELFLGYRNYQHVRQLWGWLSPMPLVARAGSARALRSLMAARLVRGRTATRLRRLANVLPARSQGEMHRLLTGLEATGLLSAVAARAVEPGAEPVVPPSASGLTQLGVMDLTTYLPDDVLVKVDRAAMAVSLETRIPFLDHRVVEFALALPEGFKVRDGQGKWIVRRLLDRYVPRALVERPKRGFAVPIAAWLRGPLRDWGEAQLAPSRLADQNLLDGVAVRAKWQEHQEGIEDHQDLLWRVLMLQAWLEHTRVR